jgi:transcriptional regulator of acetoin/glycerol metabolism
MVTTTSNHHTIPLAPLADVTRDHVLMVLEACGGRQTLAATVLKIDRKTIYRMLRRWGVAQAQRSPESALP